MEAFVSPLNFGWINSTLLSAVVAVYWLDINKPKPPSSFKSQFSINLSLTNTASI
jgi:hypothetical protein